MIPRFSALAIVALTCLPAVAAEPPAGFTALFNGKDLSGWFGEDTTDPRKLLAMSPEDLAAYQAKSLEDVNQHWKAADGELINDGHGKYLSTKKNYRDFELLVDYKTVPKADSGIYLRGCPQVQIWDPTEKEKFNIGADKGSGGLWNNSAGAWGKDPSKKMDKPFGEWNSFRILMIGERVTVHLNGEKVVDNAVMENFFDRKIPIFREGPIQLQTHGGEIRWRNVFIREIGAEEANRALAESGEVGLLPIFNGKDFTGWQGATDSYEVVDGAIRGKHGKGGVLHTKEAFADFIVRLEFRLPPAGNNGLAIRYPGQGDGAYTGMTELQVLDDEHATYNKSEGGVFKGIDDRQRHGSAYGMAAASYWFKDGQGVRQGWLRKQGEWNFQEVTVKGSTIRVVLNGTKILDTDVAKIDPETFMAKSKHPGKDLKSGFFGFAGHSDPVEFRNISIKRL